MHRAKRPTIVDVARHAGVSKSTVSAALRGEHGVAHETVDRVMTAVHAIGYRPQRPGISRRQKVVGVALRHLVNPYFGEVAAELEAACARAGYRMVTAVGSFERSDYSRQFETLLDLRVDALIVVSGAVPLGPLESATHDVPVVVVGRSAFEIPEVDMVLSDDERGSAAAVQHLLSLGHKNIAFVTASQRPTAITRYSAYRAAMRQAGLPINQLHIEEGSDVIEDLRRLRITGAFTDNDDTALRLMTAALDSGMSVPHDLSIVGYDGVSIGSRVRPRLTSVAQPRDQIAARCVELIYERLAGREHPRVVTIDPALTTGESCAPARSN